MWLERRFHINKAVATIVFIILSIPAFSQAQVISPEQAIDLAMKNNRDVAAADNLLESRKQERKSVSELSKTQISGTFGQYNGFPKNDNNISISQSLPFPTVFGARSHLQNDLIEDARLSQQNRHSEIRYEVRSTWHHLNYLIALHTRYVQLDSIYGIYLKAATAQHKAGETTLLEKLTIEGRSQRVKITLRENEAQIEAYTERLLALTGSGARVTTPPEPIVLEIPPNGNLLSVPSTHVLWYRQQSAVAGRETILQKNLLLPDISVGYFNQTLIGVPLNASSSEVATSSNRFQGFQLGLSLPLWLRPQVAKVRTAALRQQAIENANEQRIVEHEASIRALSVEINRYRETLDYFVNNGRVQAETIFDQSLKAFQLGETGTIELMLAMQTANELYVGYLEVLNLYNQSIIRLDYLTNQNQAK